MSIQRKITIIVANFYPDISSQLLKGVENELKKKKFTKMNTHTEFFLE